VVSLYLLSSVNVRLRARLLASLRPGSRVVSHEFGMGGWEPDMEHEVDGYPVYCWSVPAQVGGVWECSVGAGAGRERATLHLDQQFQNVFGALRSGSVTVPLVGSVVQGNRLQFTIHDRRSLFTTPMRFSGLVDGNAISGALAPERAVNERLPFAARRSGKSRIP
jgi:hypothetical protein